MVALHQHSAPGLARLLARGAVSAVEVMRAFQARIAALNPRHNAIISQVAPDVALAAARASDRRRKAGTLLGPLDGLPIAFKDTTPTKGLRTTWGSPLFRDHVPAADSIAAGRVRAAGAIPVGKTNVPEFGLGSHSYNQVFGVTRNAWNPALSAGGSSGGAAVAMALRLVPLADGSDMGGSLRNPAAWNNLFGFRPSQGRVPFFPTEDVYSSQLGTEGPMGRTVADLLFLLAVQAGADARVPLALRDEAGLRPAGLRAPVAGRRLLWLGDLDGHLTFEPGVLPLCEKALGVFRALGCSVGRKAPRLDWEAVWQAFIQQRHYEVGGKLNARFADPAQRALMKPELVWEMEGFRRLDAARLYQANVVRSGLAQAFAAVFETHDAVLLPTAQVFPFAVEQHWPAEVGGRAMDSYHRWMEVTVLATMLGSPCATVPVGFDAAGRPMGMQVIGRPGADMATLGLAAAYERATPFAGMAPAED